jgi:hypothetical protein
MSALIGPLIWFLFVSAALFAWFWAAHVELRHVGAGLAPDVRTFRGWYRTLALVYEKRNVLRAGPLMFVSGVIVTVGSLCALAYAGAVYVCVLVRDLGWR